MNFETWIVKWRFPNSRDGIIKIAEQLELDGNESRDVFKALVKYCNENFDYNVADFGLREALRRKQLCCTSACNLTIGVILYLTKLDVDVESYGIFGGNTAVITPVVDLPGVRIQNNMKGGGGRMLFSKSHYVAVIDNEQYDLITGLRAHNIYFRDPRPADDTDGKPTFQCELNGVPRMIIQIGDMDTGLAMYEVNPPIE